jgi:hypothetical protein
MPTGTRHCRTCGKAKPLSEFHRNYWSTGGRLHHCKDCTRESRKQRPTQLSIVDERHLARIREFPYIVVFHGGPDDGVTYRVRAEPKRYFRAEGRAPLLMDEAGGISFSDDWVNVWTYELIDFDGVTAHYRLRGVDLGGFCIAG